MVSTLTFAPMTLALWQMVLRSFAIAVGNRNFVHTPTHFSRVRENAQAILLRQNSHSLGEEEKQALELACYWHDVGRNDWEESSVNNHHEISIHLFEGHAREVGLPLTLVATTTDIIARHRNRGADPAKMPSTLAHLVLWDADKLDIINAVRVHEILTCYECGVMAGEFTPQGSLAFWETITPAFVHKFKLEATRQLFEERYPAFHQAILFFKDRIADLNSVN